MKRLFTLLLLSFAALSCETGDEKLDDLLDKRDWVVFAEGTELTVDVPSEQIVLNYHFESTLDWEVKTDAEWLEIDPMSGKAGKDIKIQIKVFHNKDKEARTGYVDLTLSNEESYRITINQAGEGDENDDIVVDIPNNQIWYTSVNGEVVEPYSGEYNNYADAFTTFGGNILSNTYVDGKGVVEFDAPITTIGKDAFYLCSNLKSLTIPDSVTAIGGCTFEGCENLTSVTIGDSVTTIGYGAFATCISLTSVTIPDSVTTIGEYAFANCYSLTSITIPDSGATIGYGAFEDCCNLTSITIPDSVTTIGEAAFAGCSSLQEFIGKFASEDGRCLIIDGMFNSFAVGCGATEYTIPDSITTIGYGAFALCSSLTSVTIPDSVTTIGDFAFYHCSRLTSVTIPDSVTAIGECAFVCCNRLKEFKSKFASEDGRCLIIDGTLNSFAPAGLTEYTIPDSVTTIGNDAFSDCSSLTSVTIGDSVTTIGNYAFSDCRSLTSITIPDSVTTIGNEAFYSCWILKSVYCKATTPPAGGSDMFYNNASVRKIYVPMESVEAYKSASYWSDYADAIVGYDF